jgi:hypothetical protein
MVEPCLLAREMDVARDGARDKEAASWLFMAVLVQVKHTKEALKLRAALTSTNNASSSFHPNTATVDLLTVQTVSYPRKKGKKCIGQTYTSYV